MPKPKIKSDGRTITVRVPIAIRTRGGRKVVRAPDGTQSDPSKLLCRQSPTMTLATLMGQLPVVWKEQRAKIGA